MKKLNKMENLKSIENVQPFQIVCIEVNKEEKYFIALGKYRYPKMYDSFEEAKKQIETKSWEILGFYTEVFINYLTNKLEENGCNKKNN